MRKIIPALFLLSFLSPITIQAQEAAQSKQKIADAIAGYFELDRESFHIHFDKKIFFTNEEIWFKGYVFNKKNGTPFFETTNVFAVLYDDTGKNLGEQLLFSYIGTFSGSFKLGPQLKSGRYYIQFYTNWMNNFTENESAVYPLQIINENESMITDYDSPDYSKINITFQPEGGSLIEGTTNNVGVHVADCNGKPIDVKEGRIVNAAGETIRTFPVVKSGYGKFYLIPTNETYKAVFSIDDKTVEAPLPKASADGVALEVNNYALPGKTVVKLRTNAHSLPALSKKPLFLVAHQNNKSVIFDVSLNSEHPERELVITNDNLYKGINTIRVIDSDMHQIAERQICEFTEKGPDISLTYTQTSGDTIKVYGKSNYPNADMSISIMPENSLASEKENDIIGSLLVNPYLTQNITNAAYFLNQPTKAKRYELDLFLLNEKSGKYNWQDILSSTPGKTYSFDIGLAIKGTINQAVPDPKKYRIHLSSPFSLIDDYSEINAKNEFVFQNLVFSDEANFRFTLMKIPSVPVDMKFYHQILNRKRTFNKPFAPQPNACSPFRQIPLDMPFFAGGAVALDNIDLKTKSKNELKYSSKFGNAALHGYKITDENSNISLLSFIEYHGFKVTNHLGEVTISSRTATSINAGTMSPEIYLNGRQLMNFDELQDIRMIEVDEIYLNPHAIVASMKGNMGVIRIYMKKMDFSNTKTATQSYEIKEGFAKLRNYQTPLYMSTSDTGFEKYGIVHWIPTVLTDESGSFSFLIPKASLKTIVLKIEGFTPDGTLISETKTMSLDTPNN